MKYICVVYKEHIIHVVIKPSRKRDTRTAHTHIRMGVQNHLVIMPTSVSDFTY